MLITKAKTLTKSHFFRNVVVVATGTAGAQAIHMVFTPLITRLYGPEAFGLLGTFMAVIAVLTPVAALTYPIAIVLPRSDADAKVLAKFSIGLAAAVASITAVIFLTAGGWIASILNLQSITSFFLLIPIVMFFSAFQQVLTQWLIRKNQFKITARVAVFQAIIINSVKTGVGFFNPIGAMLVVITTFGQALYGILLLAGIRGEGAAKSEKGKASGSVKYLAKKYIDFPFFRAPQVVINALSQSLPILILASFFGPAVAGLYTLTKTVLEAPVVLVGMSVGNVFYPKAVELKDDPLILRDFFLKTTVILFGLGLVIFLPVFFWGPWFFSLLFGEEWLRSGEFARWVALWMVFTLSTRPAISIIPVINMQKIFLILESIFLPLKFAALYLGVFFNNEMFSVAFYCMISCIFYMVLCFITYRKIVLS
ncbi:oligosaccharide flippase family protein [Halomonas halocynthiae]|uniref:oligosaccharide flippase family protein n=1 Tax=Halomonas halocynthiae TaxID=176290 RepID=UPI00040D5CDC|nr:oligosaccharide flippase family protein [Halomonas halocynthiae]